MGSESIIRVLVQRRVTGEDVDSRTYYETLGGSETIQVGSSTGPGRERKVIHTTIMAYYTAPPRSHDRGEWDHLSGAYGHLLQKYGKNRITLTEDGEQTWEETV